MRIRTQIILAAFVLAVVPLAAIVTYSYHSSRVALESAYQREADRLTRQMDRRLASIRAELDQRLAVVSALPLPSEQNVDAGTNIATVMGDAASFVDAVEFQPFKMGEHPEATDLAEVAPPAPPAPPDEHMVIDLPPTPLIRRYVMSEEQKDLLAEVGRIGAQMGKPGLDAEEREDLRKEMDAVQNELHRVISEDRQKYQEQIRSRMKVAPVPAVAKAPAQTAVRVREATKNDLEKSLADAKKAALIFGTRFAAPVRKEGQLVGQITARISPEQVVRRILGNTSQDSMEIPFALDREGTVYTRNDEERATLDRLGIPGRMRKGQSLKSIEGWIVTTSTDPQSGLRIGVARPVGENLDELRRTAARNFSLGMGLIIFALIGIVPLSNHLTRDVKRVTEGAERIAQGDLMTRLPVKTNNELGQLAKAFNRMAEDLSRQQQRLIEQERMAVEYERKSDELEDARRFQLSMLPKQVPQHEAYDVAVYTRTATEVGGDYYDFHLADDVLSVTIGDATGHGAKAGTMVTVIKTLFAGYSGATPPASFLRDAAEKIKRMDLGRMAMALSLGRFDRRTLTLSSAGMPPVLVHRASTRTVEELALSATPLGTLGTSYNEITATLSAGDTVLFMSDGFPELMNDAGQQLGYAAAQNAFADAASGATATAVIDALEAFAARWHGDTPPNDDVTFVIVRIA